jgi:hypothetical protein
MLLELWGTGQKIASGSAANDYLFDIIIGTIPK